MHATSAALILALFASSAAAQQPWSNGVAGPAWPAPPPVDWEKPARERQGARNLEIAGIVLTLSGVCGAGLGGILMATADTRGDFGGFNLLPGLILLGATAPLVPIGIPMWIVGARRKANLSPAGASAQLRITGSGLRLEGSF
jgi:hypothetical protein